MATVIKSRWNWLRLSFARYTFVEAPPSGFYDALDTALREHGFKFERTSKDIKVCTRSAFNGRTRKPDRHERKQINRIIQRELNAAWASWNAPWSPAVRFAS